MLFRSGIEKRCSIVTWMHSYRCNHIQHFSVYILLSISNKLSNESKEGSFVSINKKSEEIHHHSKRIISTYQISVIYFFIPTKWLHLLKYFLTQFELYLMLYCSQLIVSILPTKLLSKSTPSPVTLEIAKTGVILFDATKKRINTEIVNQW